MAKEKSSGAIKSHMGPMVSSFKKGESKDMAKGPRVLVKGEVTNQVERPAKK